MAFASDSTTAPARPLLPLAVPRPELPVPPLLDRRAIAAHGWAIARTMAHHRGGEPRDHLGEGQRAAWAAAKRAAGLSGPSRLHLALEAVAQRRTAALLDDADYGRTIHLRRQLAQAAEHGAALLAALDLPRLVTPDFAPHDPGTIGEAVDRAIAALDAMDGDTDLEDGGDDELSLGWEKPGSQFLLTEGAYSGDREHDTADAEPSLASPERHPHVPTVTWSPVYTARGGDESQLRWAEGARDDRELTVEDQAHDDDELDGAGEVDGEPSIGWPEDVAAEVVFTFSAEGDAEHDDCDLEDGDADQDERDPWPMARADRFGVVAHV